MGVRGHVWVLGGILLFSPTLWAGSGGERRDTHTHTHTQEHTQEHTHTHRNVHANPPQNWQKTRCTFEKCRVVPSWPCWHYIPRAQHVNFGRSHLPRKMTNDPKMPVRDPQWISRNSLDWPFSRHYYILTKKRNPESSLNTKFLGGRFLGHQGPRRWDILDKNFMQVAFFCCLDREWPGCPRIWVGTSRIWKDFMQEPRKGGFSKGGFCRVECHAATP